MVIKEILLLVVFSILLRNIYVFYIFKNKLFIL